MECFAHPNAAGVAVCKHCSKGICRSCVVEAGTAVACSAACAKEVLETDEVMQKAKKLYGIGVTKQVLPSASIMWGVFGAVFFGWGVYSSFGARGIDWFPLIMGVACFGLGVFAYVRGRDTGLRV